MKAVSLFTDGSCQGNPGPGGWAVLIVFVDARGTRHERLLTGSVPRTTNNRMELTAALEGLLALKEPCQVQLHTDSTYVITVATGGRVRTNDDLVARLRAAAASHQVTWLHVSGHTGHPENERVNRAAQRAAAAARAQSTPSEAHQR